MDKIDKLIQLHKLTKDTPTPIMRLLVSQHIDIDNENFRSTIETIKQRVGKA